MKCLNTYVIEGDVVRMDLLKRDGSVRAVTRFDATDLSAVVDGRARWVVNYGGRTAYVQRILCENGGGRRRERLHRVLMDCPVGMVVDHINGDGLDNRRENLRVVTHTENRRHQTRTRISKTHDLPVGITVNRSGRYDVSLRFGVDDLAAATAVADHLRSEVRPMLDRIVLGQRPAGESGIHTVDTTNQKGNTT